MREPRSRIPFEPPDDGAPVYLTVARALIRDIERGRMAPGDRLPGSRTLAAQLGVSRNTVLAAFDELIAQGWVESRPASGTFVSATAGPGRSTRGDAQDPPASVDHVGYSLGRARGLPDVPAATDRVATDLSAGVPDGRLVPVDLLARAYRRVLRARGAALLGYGDPRGEPSLRAELARHLSDTRGVVVGADNLLVTRGSQMALALVANLLLRPGDRVAVERYGYRPAWDAIRRTGAELVPISVDRHGVCTDELLSHENIRAVYLTPHHQFPTMALLSPDRRAALLRWARAERIAVIEDDYDHEFHYRGQPVMPLIVGDRSGVVAYVGSLSKVLAPALRIGFLVGPRALVDRASRLRMTWDRQGDRATEAAVADLFALGDIQRHVRKVRRANADRRAALAGAIDKHLSGVLEYDVPPGGLSLWARVVDGTDPVAWATASASLGVRFGTGADYHFRGSNAPFVRLAFAAHTPDEIEKAVRTIANAHRRCRGR